MMTEEARPRRLLREGEAAARPRGRGPLEDVAEAVAPVLLQTHPRVQEVGEEGVLVASIDVDVLLECRVIQQRQVRLQHHGLARTRAVPVLRLALARGLLRPRLAQEVLEVRVVKHERLRSPGALEAGAVGVARANGVSPREGHDALVIEALRVEDLPEVRSPLVAVGETAGGRLDAVRRGLRVQAAEARGDVGAVHQPDRDVGRDDPEVGVGDEVGAVLLRDGGQEAEGDRGKAGVGPEGSLAR
mmetsp:Transcript_70468/g.206658  ORF Transcript_70468/g.206658 Transcript_70468/m.206658 type:complete len:245 (+) Transcript_70468:335-1069(+)